jgi:hypothetical protein
MVYVVCDRAEFSAFTYIRNGNGNISFYRRYNKSTKYFSHIFIVLTVFKTILKVNIKIFLINQYIPTQQNNSDTVHKSIRNRL